MATPVKAKCWALRNYIFYIQMCQKSPQVFKQFYALMIVSPVTRSLQVFKLPPTQLQIDEVIRQKVIGKMEPAPFIYSEKPKVEVVPIDIPANILYP
jgi:hypothetical protein